MNYSPQVEKTHYSFSRYFYKGRWMSYWYQAKEITSRSDIHTVLDVGPGTDFLRYTLKIHRADIEYKTIDIATDLNPDIIGGVTKMPIADDSYDAVCAFQVLEHIIFSDFETAICEMKRVSKRYVLLSLPHFGTSFEFALKIPLLPRFQFYIKIPWPRKHKFQGQHYWEIGKFGYSARNVRNIIKKHFVIINEYIPAENQYHRFYILQIT